ncbi:DUF2812 domain-containing protein [Anaerocolumna sp.]|uniref:DUF2812 domain-containing protein n=1 Tax=Anaerocolumna sp. TaxID=2041569 RepID=UPI0028A5F6C1|nr:DUF2812 domain-containing protein [Anaerocolumna sp.]
MIKIFKVFFSDLDKQEKWLNEKAQQGLKLVKASKLFYYFEKCKPSEYIYKLEFIIDKSMAQQKDYRAFLEELGIHSFTKNFGFGNYSYGKIQYSLSAGRVRTSPGTINSELLILEKKNDGKPFEVFTEKKDKLSYYRKVRNAFIFPIAALLTIAIVGKPQLDFIHNQELINILHYGVKVLTICVCIPLLITVLRTCFRINELKKDITIE